jgi:hypothetical protein
VQVHKKVKEHSVHEAQFLSSNHRVLPWCTQALAFIESLVVNINSQDFNVSLAVHHVVRNLLWQKMLRQQKTVTFFSRERFSEF